jgi:lysophospholipase L1-like esterase
LYYSATKGVTRATGTRVASISSPKIVTGLNNGTTYYFVVTAVKADSESTESSEISVTPPVQYVAIGDSITFGTADDIAADGIGYEPILSELLVGVSGIPNRVENEGIPAIGSASGAALISSVLAKYPHANFYLVMYGTPDTFIPAKPSGIGLKTGENGYSGSYKDNMQRIISAIRGAGRTPILAKIPYNRITASFDDRAVQEYNMVIDELVAENGISVAPPDFYGWFRSHPEELVDWIHPGGVGYRSMANIWFNALIR